MTHESGGVDQEERMRATQKTGYTNFSSAKNQRNLSISELPKYASAVHIRQTID